MALPIFAITLFISAFLLFLVQPMIGKMLLPNLGGTPQVWNTCMVFFQTALLLGYAYTHTVSTRLKLRSQLILHSILLLIPLALLLTGTFSGRIYNYVPPPGANPVLATLGVLGLVVGLPFFVVSTSAPLLQKWFAHTGHPTSHDPYFLYGASNLGSMLSLVFYPFLVEPTLGLLDQSWIWAIGYLALVVLFFVCVAMVWNAPPTVEIPETAKQEEPAKEVKKEPVTAVTAKAPAGAGLSTRIRKGQKQRGRATTTPRAREHITAAPPTVGYTEVRSDDMTPWRRLRWVLLAFAPSSLMLGITTYISTDVSAIPLFWVIPLALYLLSFILVFSKWPVTWTRMPHTLMVVAMPIALFFFVYLLLTHQINPIWRTITFCLLAFFLTTMVCHGELARDRPSTKHLTEFYLWMSVGGMLGGIFNALLAPVVFTWGLVELPIAIIVGCLMRPQSNRLFPVDMPILVIFGGFVGLICGSVYGYAENALLMWFVVGTVIGVIIAVGTDFTRQTGGWTESILLNIFPDLGTWADEKGRELKQEASGKTEEEQEKAKPRIRTVAAPDYYVLNYMMDFALPILLAFFLLVMYMSQGSSSAFGEQAGVKGLLESVARGLGFKADSARIFAERNGFLALVYGIPLVCSLILFASRPIRCGLAIAALFLITGLMSEDRAELLERDRSYFGNLQVLKEDRASGNNPLLTAAEASIINQYYPDSNVEVGALTPYTYLMHGTTHHGLNYQSPEPLRRLATTYYHRYGPVGAIMERFNWFPGPQNTYLADNRFPASVVAMGTNPLAGLVNLWSEPPYATVGLGTGTMASYGRPFQHVTFYEIDNKIRHFSLPVDGSAPHFNYLHDAREKRGVNLEVIMGDARMSMRTDQEKKREEERQNEHSFGEGAGEKQLNERDYHQGIHQRRQGYYHAIELDAFSSDAIPVHLITEEAILQYFDKLAPGGVLLVHTSNRHVELPDPVMNIVADINKHAAQIKDLATRKNISFKEAAKELNLEPFYDPVTGRPLELEYRVVNCAGAVQEITIRTPSGFRAANIGSGSRGHFQSEYVMVARKVPGDQQQAVEERWQQRLKQLEPTLSKHGDTTLEEHVKHSIDMGASYLPKTSEPSQVKLYDDYSRRHMAPSEPYHRQIWAVYEPPGASVGVWTDDYSNLMSVFRWGFR